MAQSKSQLTQQRIFEASLRLFTQKGYGSTTVRDIAQAADISTGLLFHYFPNKQALLTAHLELAAYGMDTVRDLLTSKQPPISVFTSVAETALAGLREPAPRLLYLLMNQPLPADAIPPALQKRLAKDTIIELSTRLIEQGQRQGSIKPGNPQALAVTFWGAIQGTAEVLAQQPDVAVPEVGWVVGVLRA